MFKLSTFTSNNVSFSKSVIQFNGIAKVIDYGFADNNRVIVEVKQDGRKIGCVAEWLDIVTKVEIIVDLIDIVRKYQGDYVTDCGGDFTEECEIEGCKHFNTCNRGYQFTAALDELKSRAEKIERTV